MILYFTGTGNSRFAAEYIAEYIGDECVSLNEIIKNERLCHFCSEKPYIIAAPIYAWRFPLIIENLIEKAIFSGSRKIYFIGTMGSQSGNSDRYLKKLAENKSLEYMGFCGISMPNNYVSGGKLPDKAQAEDQIRAALLSLKTVSERIADGQKISKTDKTPLASLFSGVVNRLFNKFMVSSREYAVSEGCTGCGKCVSFCPVNNIEMQYGNPLFGDKCLNCYGCINRCPAEAINIGNKTQKNGRYVCPDYKDWKRSEKE